MNIRKDPLINGQYYHIYNRSIAKFIIFNSAEDYYRMIDIIKLYCYADFNYKYSRYIELEPLIQKNILNSIISTNNVLIEIVAYCLMPTHFHLILKQIVDDGISKYIARMLNSYSRYFNSKLQRTGPLWAGKFKNVLVSNDEQLLHLTRYIHLNPVSINLVDKCESWPNSSYSEYASGQEEICSYQNLFNFMPNQYKKFVKDRREYQREISRIKNILIDNYSG